MPRRNGLRRTYECIDSEIEKSGGPWLLGEEISLGDIALMPAIVHMADLGQGFLIGLPGRAIRPIAVPTGRYRWRSS